MALSKEDLLKLAISQLGEDFGQAWGTSDGCIFQNANQSWANVHAKRNNLELHALHSKKAVVEIEEEEEVKSKPKKKNK